MRLKVVAFSYRISIHGTISHLGVYSRSQNQVMNEVFGCHPMEILELRTVIQAWQACLVSMGLNIA